MVIISVGYHHWCYLRRKLENWLFLKFFFIHCKTVKVTQNDQIRMYTWFTSVFLLNGTELRSFSHFQILFKITYTDLSWKLENWLFLEFFFIHCKTVKVTQNDQIRMYTWFTSVFLLNGTELRSFSHFQILTKITYPDLSWKLENWLFLEFSFIHWKTVKVSQNDQIRMQTWLTIVFLMNGTELRSFCHFPILSWIIYSDLSRNLGNWLLLKFVFNHCNTVKVSQNDQIQMETLFTSGFLMNGTELRSFSHFQIFKWNAYSDLSRNLENWLILMFAFIPCETVKVSEDDQIRI